MKAQLLTTRILSYLYCKLEVTQIGRKHLKKMQAGSYSNQEEASKEDAVDSLLADFNYSGILLYGDDLKSRPANIKAIKKLKMEHLGMTCDKI